MQRSRSIAISGESASGFSKWRLGSMKRELPPGPSRYEMSCSGHSPPLSQTGQSSGWLTSRNSTTAFCASLHPRRSACGRPCRRGPGSSRRSAASGSPRSRPGTCGRRRPARRASARNRRPGSRRRRAWRRRRASSPSGAVDLAAVDRRSVIAAARARHLGRRLLGAASGGAARRRSAARARPARASMCVLELVAELLDHRADRHRHRVAEHAEAVADDVAPGPRR